MDIPEDEVMDGVETNIKTELIFLVIYGNELILYSTLIH